MRGLQIAAAAAYAVVLVAACLFRVSCADGLHRQVLRNPELYGPRFADAALAALHPPEAPGPPRSLIAALDPLLSRPSLLDPALTDRALALLDRVAAAELDAAESTSFAALVVAEGRLEARILDALPPAARRALAAALVPDFGRRVRDKKVPSGAPLTAEALDPHLASPAVARKVLTLLFKDVPALTPGVAVVARSIETVDDASAPDAARAVARIILDPDWSKFEGRAARVASLLEEPAIGLAYLRAAIPGEHPSRALIDQAFAALPAPARRRLSAELCQSVSGSLGRLPGGVEEKVIAAAGDGLTPALYAAALRLHATDPARGAWNGFRLRGLMQPALRRPELRPSYEAFLAALSPADRAAVWGQLAADPPAPAGDPAWAWLEPMARREIVSLDPDGVRALCTWLEASSLESQVAVATALLRLEYPGAVADPAMRGADPRSKSALWREVLLRFQPGRRPDAEDVYRMLDRVTVQADAEHLVQRWAAGSPRMEAFLRDYLQERPRAGTVLWKAASRVRPPPAASPSPAPRPADPAVGPPPEAPTLVALAERMLKEIDAPTTSAGERRRIAIQGVGVAQHLASRLDRVRLVRAAGAKAIRDLHLEPPLVLAEMKALAADEQFRFPAGLEWMEADPGALQGGAPADWGALLADARVPEDRLLKIVGGGMRAVPVTMKFLDVVAAARKVEGGGAGLLRRLVPADGKPSARVRACGDLLGGQSEGTGDPAVFRALLKEVVAIAGDTKPASGDPLVMVGRLTIQRRAYGPDLQADLIQAFKAVPAGHIGLRHEWYDAIVLTGNARAVTFLIENLQARGTIPATILQRVAGLAGQGAQATPAMLVRWLEENRGSLKDQIK